MLGRRAPGDPSDAPAPSRHRHRAVRTFRARLSVDALWPAAALVLVVLLGLRAVRQAARPGEGLLSAEAFLRTATRDEPSAAVLSPDGLAALHMAVYAAVTRAFDRADTLVAAGREPLLVVTVVSAVLLWGTARRLGFGFPSTAVAMLVAGVPPLLSTMGLLDLPARFAVPWLLLAALLTAGGAPSRTGLGIALGSAVLAVLLAPDVLVLLLTGGASALLTGDLQPGGTRRARLIAAALLGGAAAGVALLLADPAPGAGAFGVASGVLTTAALAFVVIGGLAAATGGALRVPALALVATALLTLPSGRLSALVICLPVAALLIAGLAGNLVRPLAGTSRRVLRIAAATALAAAVLAGVVVLLRTPAPIAAGPNPAGAVIDWAETGLPPDVRLVADGPLRAQLIHAGADQDAVMPPGARPEDPATTVLAVVNGQPPDGASVLARFAGEGAADPLLVVDPAPGMPTAEELSRRRSLAAALLDNPATMPGERAADVLRSGEVDPRLLSVLAALGAQFGVGVQDFPVAHGEPGEGLLARRAIVDHLAGDPLLPGAPATERLETWLEAQLPPFAPDSVISTDEGVRIDFAYVSAPDALVTASAP